MMTLKRKDRMWLWWCPGDQRYYSGSALGNHKPDLDALGRYLKGKTLRVCALGAWAYGQQVKLTGKVVLRHTSGEGEWAAYQIVVEAVVEGEDFPRRCGLDSLQPLGEPLPYSQGANENYRERAISALFEGR